ncbi:hypothetical protein H634G_11459 [Metarhizium anisopliae BRIP 53293]|uniref:Uncharacterized protein n=1 Tax=Metarhizium anisopliae BRIP 53293 TaxID=1291518 RepID=A0A0D9NI10_METAN|nr:hypothetical protein H634G_11459 [Metarhizium anisopliae BRIP 53293]
MESSKNNMPSSLIIEAYNPSTQYQSIPDHSEAVSKIDDCARELEAAVKRLLKRTEHARKAEQVLCEDGFHLRQALRKVDSACKGTGQVAD